MNLAAHFVICNYIEGNEIFYMASENNEGKTIDVTDDIIKSWNANWVNFNYISKRIGQ